MSKYRKEEEQNEFNRGYNDFIIGKECDKPNQELVNELQWNFYKDGYQTALSEKLCELHFSGKKEDYKSLISKFREKKQLETLDCLKFNRVPKR